MRLNKTQFLSSIKSNLKIEFAQQDITAYGGLELIRRYFRIIGLHSRVQSVFARHHIGGDYRAIDMILVLLALLLTGGNRLDHIAHLTSDPLVRRFCGLLQLPSGRSVSRWLKRFTMKSLQALVEVNSQIVCEEIEKQEIGKLTIDVDGSVVTTGGTVAWAFRGFNPHHRKDPSYYPILAHLAQTGHILKVKNRPGNVHDSKGAVVFLRELMEDLKARLSSSVALEFRMDGAFFQKGILNLLDGRKIPYAIKVPFFKWLNLVPIIRERKRWTPLKAGMGFFELSLPIPAWDRKIRVVVYRKPVHHVSRKNYQLDLFDPDDGYYEYSAVTTGTDWSAAFLWDFMAGRGAQEKTYGELKGEWAFDTIPTRHYGANSAWQHISVMGHNLIRNFQLATTASPKAKTRKRTFSFLLQSLKTLRFKLIHQPARIVRPQGVHVLRFSVAKPTQVLIEAIQQKIAA